MSVPCQQQTYAPQQGLALFNYLVGPDEQRRRDFETKHPGGSQVDYQIESGRQHERQFANLFAF